MKRQIIGTGLVIALIAFLAISRSQQNRAHDDHLIFAPTPETQGETKVLTPTPAPEMTPSHSVPQITQTSSQQLAAEADPQLGALKEMLRDYRARLGENPIGTNEEITKSLLGKNPGAVNFKSTEVQIENGKLVDRWHHPYFFHQLSQTEMEIRSAGPDGVMWTADDEVLR